MSHYPAICVDEVKYAGDVVAVVLATDKYVAADALDLVDVDYEHLDAVVDMEEALAAGSPLVHADFGTNECYVANMPCGDYAAVKAKADVVVKRRFINQRLIPNPMEPRSVVAAPMGHERRDHRVDARPRSRTCCASCSRCSPASRRTTSAWSHPTSAAGSARSCRSTARRSSRWSSPSRLGRPIKWTETRSEHMVATHHGRDQIQDIEIAATKDGTILGLKVDLLADMGAYLQIITPGHPAARHVHVLRHLQDGGARLHLHRRLHDKTPTDAYRGAGRPEATYAIERIVDEVAAELGMEPMELRQKNWITHEEFPYTQIAGLTYDSGNYEAATARALELFGYDELRAEQTGPPRGRRPGAARHRHLDVHRDVRARAVAHPRRAQVRRGRLGALHDPRPAHREDRAHHRYVAARSGPRDRVEPDRERHHRGARGGHRGRPRRHRTRAVRHGHLRLAVAGRRRPGDQAGRRAARREGAAHRRAPARGEPGRHRVLRRHVLGQGRPGEVHDDPGGRVRGLHGAQPARRHRADAVGRVDGRPGGLLLPARHAPRRHGGRHRDRARSRCASTSPSTTAACRSTR